MHRYIRLPDTVENFAIRVDPEHDIVSSGVVDKGALGVNEEHVRDPDLLHQAAIEGHTLVGGAGEGQSLILPVVPQIQSHGEVL